MELNKLVTLCVLGIASLVLCATAAPASSHDGLGNAVPVESAGMDDNLVYEFDPTFKQDLENMSPMEDSEFLNPDLMFNCIQRYRFVQCLEHYLRKSQFQRQPNYKPFLIDLEESSDGGVIKRASLFGKPKRTSNDELMNLFKNAIAKNMKLKSSIKTTRF